MSMVARLIALKARCGLFVVVERRRAFAMNSFDGCIEVVVVDTESTRFKTIIHSLPVSY